MLNKEFLKHLATELNSVYDKEESIAIARYVLKHANEANRIIPEDEISNATVDFVEALLPRLKSAEPVQYVLGFAYFMNSKYKVNNKVLIPRPETEELLELVRIKTQKEKSFIALDIGTGSGCIAIEMKKKLPQAKVYAVDISEDALAVAGENAALHQTSVEFVCDNILAPDFSKYPESIDMIVSNPPYISSEEKTMIHANVLGYEPHLALFASENPVEFYEAIAIFSQHKLKQEGEIYLEINPVYANRVIEIFQNERFKNVETAKDITGRERFLYGRK